MFRNFFLSFFDYLRKAEAYLFESSKVRCLSSAFLQTFFPAVLELHGYSVWYSWQCFELIHTVPNCTSLCYCGRYVGENLLLMPNHQSTADVPFMMTIFTARPGFAGKAMWIMDKVREESFI